MLHYFYELGGITVIFRDGTRIHETTPAHMTGFEHLATIKTNLKSK